jgi:phosphate acyltransferase
MKIGLDAMGGDFAPDATVEGAVDALDKLPQGDRLVLIGDNGRIREKLASLNVEPSLFDIVATTQVIEMSDHPAKAFSQKKTHQSLSDSACSRAVRSTDLPAPAIPAQ